MIMRTYKCRICGLELKNVRETHRLVVKRGLVFRVVAVKCPIHGTQYHWIEVGKLPKHHQS